MTLANGTDKSSPRRQRPAEDRCQWLRRHPCPEVATLTVRRPHMPEAVPVCVTHGDAVIRDLRTARASENQVEAWVRDG